MNSSTLVKVIVDPLKLPSLGTITLKPENVLANNPSTIIKINNKESPTSQEIAQDNLSFCGHL